MFLIPKFNLPELKETQRVAPATASAAAQLSLLPNIQPESPAMAQKRAAKGSVRPPPPAPAPAPAASSEESDSRSRSEESEDEAVSPIPAPSKPPALLQKGEESESSDEEEEEEEEASNKPPAPPQKGEESESSDEEEEGEEEEEEEEPAQAVPPSAPKIQPPPPQQSKESDEEGEEGESSESDEEAPPPKPVPKREAEDIKPPSAKKARLAFHRIWSIEDEVRILEALAAHRKQHGALPQPDALISALAGKLDNRAYSSKELQSKLQTLKKRCVILAKRGELTIKEHDRRLLDLSKIVWGGDKTTVAPSAAAKGASVHELKGFEEMCELYPHLAEEVKKLDAAHPGMFKRVFWKMDDDKARAMDEKIKKLRIVQMKVELRRTELSKEVAKAMMELVD